MKQHCKKNLVPLLSDPSPQIREEAMKELYSILSSTNKRLVDSGEIQISALARPETPLAGTHTRSI
jgi:hypothetical protein